MFGRREAEIHHMSPALFHRLLQRKPAAPTTLRMHVCPPDVCPARESLWTTTLRWLVGDDVESVPALRTPLERARAEFIGAIGSLADLDATCLRSRAGHARSLRELWHLRSELYTLIARRESQVEANTRLARVNQHFPTRAQRAGTPAPETADVN